MADADSLTYAALRSVVGMKAYPDEAPPGTKPPYAVYQAVGGVSNTDLDNNPDDLQNARMQVAIWSPDKGESVRCMQEARRAMMRAGAVPIGAPTSAYETDTKLHGRRLDFSIWFKE
ncbi:hypothetical protein WL05_21025 [Burkholderia ubonensis]|uniref:tail completion protein gp17 n=1 Tax=Burkholderia ubonensis TaxID=101571 RepID=UPI00075D5C3F|nr:DUF3168 domain-containing protein [Burkholderia ubonensis]KVX45299.1 hypothetical protein WL05_21025 [Burkholderia ubonensis]